MLQRDVQIRQHLAGRHQRNHIIHMRIRIDVMQAHPDIQLAQLLAQRQHAGLHRGTVIEAGTVLDVSAIGRGVLRNHQQLFDTGLFQTLGFGQHFTDRTAHQITAQRRNDAEGAAMVAAFGDLQIGIVTRGELDALRRHQAGERIVGWLRYIAVHMLQHLLIGVRAADLQHLGVNGADLIFLGTQTTGDDHLAVLFQRFADCFQRLLHRAVDKAAGVDDHQLGVVVAVDHLVAFSAQLGQDAFGIDEILRATQRNKTDTGRARGGLGRRSWLVVEHLPQRGGGAGTGGVRVEGVYGHRCRRLEM